MFSHLPFALPWESQPHTVAIHQDLMRFRPLAAFVGKDSAPELRGQSVKVLTGATYNARRGRQAIIHAGTTDQTNLVFSSQHISAEHVTIFLHYEKTDGTLRASSAFGVTGATDTERCGAHLPYSDGTVYWDFGGTGANQRVSVGSLTFSDDIWCFTAGPRGLEIWQNGLLRAESGAAVGGRSSLSASEAFVLGANANGIGASGSDLAAYYSLVFFNEQMPQTLIANITRSQRSYYGSLFQPMDLYGFKAAGGGAFTVTADRGDYALTGADTSTLLNRLIGAAQGTYALTGQDVALTVGRLISAGQGDYTLTGVNAALLKAGVISAAQGDYVLGGIDATLTKTGAGSKSITADQGAYALTGADATLILNRVLAAAQGGFTIGAIDATVFRAFTLAAEAGTYTTTGVASQVLLARVLAAGEAAYALGLPDATLTKSAPVARSLSAEAGSFTFDGLDATLTAPSEEEVRRGGTSRRDLRLRKRPRFWWEEDDRPEPVLDTEQIAALPEIKQPDYPAPEVFRFDATPPAPKEQDFEPIVRAIRKRGRMKLAAIVAMRMLDE